MHSLLLFFLFQKPGFIRVHGGDFVFAVDTVKYSYPPTHADILPMVVRGHHGPRTLAIVRGNVVGHPESECGIILWAACLFLADACGFGHSLRFASLFLVVGSAASALLHPLAGVQIAAAEKPVRGASVPADRSHSILVSHRLTIGKLNGVPNPTFTESQRETGMFCKATVTLRGNAFFRGAQITGGAPVMGSNKSHAGARCATREVIGCFAAIFPPAWASGPSLQDLRSAPWRKGGPRGVCLRSAHSRRGDLDLAGKGRGLE
jgi:hypothetical protein